MKRTIHTKPFGFAGPCMDLSDGLSSDLRRVCEANDCGAEIWEAAVPVAPGATLDQALNGGEDYELLFAAQQWKERVPAEIAGVPVTRIGSLVPKSSGVRLLRRDGTYEELVAGGWEHLRG